MKTIYRIIVALVICITQTNIVLAQNKGKWSLTPKLGITNGHWVGDHAAYESNRLGWTVGVEAENKICERLSLSFGLQYSHIGSTDDINKHVYESSFRYIPDNKIYSISYTLSNQRKNLGYIQIPVLANLYLTKGLSIKTGVQLGILTRAKLKTHMEGYDEFVPIVFDKDETENICSEFSKADFTIPVGISYELKNVVLDARYYFGIHKIKRHSPDRIYNRYLSITLGYKFNL